MPFHHRFLRAGLHLSLLVLPLLLPLLLPVLLPFLPAVAAAQASAKPATVANRPAPAASSNAGAARQINWDALVQPGWDPYKEIGGNAGANLQSLGDGDPRAIAMLKKLREVWDNAPVNKALEGQPVRIPGYVVPLEDSKDGVTEFLLVPYFGACIHTPPPPSNQIIHVLPKSPAKGLRQMDTVWITGRMHVVQNESYMGTSSWQMEAETVAPFVDGKGGK